LIARNQSVTKINTIAGSRAQRIWIDSPVCIRIHRQRIHRTSDNLKTRGQGALDIAQDALDKCKMRLPWVMHKQTDLLDSIGDIRMSES
jgi:hypothetical protein